MKQTKVKLMKFFIFSLLILFCLPLFGQEENTSDNTENIADSDTVNEDSNGSVLNTRGKYRLGKIVVTPTKTSRKAGDSPASVSVIDSDDISVSSGKLADETMKSLPGVYLKRSKFGDTTATVNIRGFSGGRRNLVLFNGMPINDGYSSAVNWSAISADSVGSIEVVKGPFSSLYGRNAMGGVINMLTKTPSKLETSVKTGYGSNNTYSGSVYYGDRLFNSLSISLSGDYSSTDGYRSNLVRTNFAAGTTGTSVTGMEPATDATGSAVTSSGQPYFIIGDKGKNFAERWGCSGGVVYDFTSNSRISYTFNVRESSYGYRDGRSYLKNSSGSSVSSGAVTFNYNGTDYTKTIYQNTFLDGSGEDFSQMHILDYSLKSDLFNLSAKLGYNLAEKWYTTPGTGSSGADFSGGPGKVSKTDPKETGYCDLQGDLMPSDFITITLGVSGRTDSAENNDWKITDWKDPDSTTDLPADHISEMKGEQLFTSAYSQVELKLLEKIVTLYLGARYDHWKNYNGSSRYNTVDAEYGTTTDSYISPKIAVLIKPLSEIALRASYGHSYSPPDIYQLYKYWEYYSTKYYPNPDLKPEQSRTWEIGTDISFLKKSIIVSGAYFGSVIKDMFYNRQVDSSTKVYANAGEGEIKGYEAEVRVYPLDSVELFGNITKTYTEITKNDDDPDSVGKDFTNVPELMYNAGLKVFTRKAEGSLNWRYCDKVYNVSDNSDTAEKTYGAYDDIKLLDVKLSVMPQDNIKFSLSVNNIMDREYYQYYLCDGRTYFAEAEIKL